jgi:hypothetical protein
MGDGGDKLCAFASDVLGVDRATDVAVTGKGEMFSAVEENALWKREQLCTDVRAACELESGTSASGPPLDS